MFLSRGPQRLEDRVGRSLPFGAVSVLRQEQIGQGPGRTEPALSLWETFRKGLLPKWEQT